MVSHSLETGVKNYFSTHSIFLLARSFKKRSEGKTRHEKTKGIEGKEKVKIM